MFAAVTNRLFGGVGIGGRLWRAMYRGAFQSPRVVGAAAATQFAGFVRCTRGGATSITAAAVTVMVVGVTALITDHLWLVDQRDALKRAVDAATVATTLRMGQIRSTLSDAEIGAALEPIARRYIELNLTHLPERRLTRAKETLVLTVSPNREAGTVHIVAESDLGGTLLSRHMPMLGLYKGPEAIHVGAGAERTVNAIEVVLAIDVSGSMVSTLAGRRAAPGQRRIDIIKRAAASLVDILDPNSGDRVAVGVVPWDAAVRLDPSALERWTENDWAQYPRGRHYGAIYACDLLDSTSCTAVGEYQDLPSSPPEDWLGCLDDHRIAGASRRAALPEPAELLAPPSASAFAQAIYPATYGTAYRCLAPPRPPNAIHQYCYEERRLPQNRQSPRQPQWTCRSQTILPLTTDRRRIDQAIYVLRARGLLTNSGLGVLWGQRLLDGRWKRVWGDTAHPVDRAEEANEGVRKAIVLLTDGEDTYCGKANVSCSNSPVAIGRDAACTAAKAAGSEIFVIAAMVPRLVSQEFARALRACSSASDNPDGSYVFLNNATPERLEAAFADIANQLVSVRRVY